MLDVTRGSKNRNQHNGKETTLLDGQKWLGKAREGKGREGEGGKGRKGKERKGKGREWKEREGREGYCVTGSFF